MRHLDERWKYELQRWSLWRRPSSTRRLLSPFQLKSLQSARGVIAERQKCADTYAAKSVRQTGRASVEDQTHQHFIGILQRVLSTLLTAISPNVFFGPKRTVKQKLQQYHTPAVEIASDISEALDIQQPADLENSTGNTTEPLQVDPSEAKFTTDKTKDSIPSRYGVISRTYQTSAPL